MHACVCTLTIVLENNSSSIDAYHQLQGEILSLVSNRESSSCECEESVMCFMCELLCTMFNVQWHCRCAPCPMSNSYLSEKNCVDAHPLNVPLVVRASIYVLAASSN